MALLSGLVDRWKAVKAGPFGWTLTDGARRFEPAPTSGIPIAHAGYFEPTMQICSMS